MKSFPPTFLSQKGLIITLISVAAVVLFFIIFSQRETLFGQAGLQGDMRAGIASGRTAGERISTAGRIAERTTPLSKALPTFASPFKINPRALLGTLIKDITVCGNNLLERGEECEDGNRIDGDGCSSQCRCTAGTVVATCRYAVCGDGIIMLGEECDDGNTVPADGCDPLCRIESWSVEVPAPPPPLTCYSCAAGGAGCTAMTLEGESCTPFYGESTCSSECVAEVSTEVPPTDGDRALCTQPNPFDLPPGTRFRDFPDSRHISICETETSARYIICGGDGTTTVNVEPCSEGVSCADGACTDDARWTGECWDSDGGLNPGTPGYIEYRIDEEVRTDMDSCIEFISVNEFYCVDDELPRNFQFICEPDEHCEEGACVPGGPTCSDPDDDDIHTAGTTTVTLPDGRSESYYDSCDFNQEGAFEYICDISGRVRQGPFELSCPADEHCEGGRCIPGEPLEVTCDDPDGLDRTVAGTTTLRRSDGATSTNTDICMLDLRGVYETRCLGSNRIASGDIPCLDTEYCDAGRCVAGCRCTRTGATAERGGYVRGNNCIEQPDICEGAFLHVYRCDTEAASATYGLPVEDTSRSRSCPDGCDTTRGVCR